MRTELVGVLLQRRCRIELNLMSKCLHRLQAYEIFIITVNVIIFHHIKLEGKMFFHVLNYEYLISRCVHEKKHHLVILQKNKLDTLHRQTHKLSLTKTNYFSISSI